MDRRHAEALLGLPPIYTADQVEVAFRAAAWRMHPDRGGDAGQFQELVEGRALLLQDRREPTVVIRDDRGIVERMIGRWGRRKRPRAPRLE